MKHSFLKLLRARGSAGLVVPTQTLNSWLTEVNETEISSEVYYCYNRVMHPMRQLI